jgi:chemotaxis protein MotB
MKIFYVGALFAFAATGCVSNGKYDAEVAKTAATQAELDRNRSQLAQVATDLDQRRAEVEQRRAEIAQLKSENAALANTKTASGARISELQNNLAALEAAQSAAAARAALYKDLSLRLKRQIDDGDLSIAVRDGRMVLQLPNDVLFDTGRTELKPAGKKAIEAIAGVMKSLKSRHFQIAGHTDNLPISNAEFASNWELSSGRALRVVHFLIDKGVDASELSAAGYSEIDPVAKNDTADGKRRNRRTEITLQPNIDELVKVPQ